MDNIKSSGDVSTEDDWLITEEMKSSVRGGDGEEELKEITIGDDEKDHVITGLGDAEDEKEDEDDDPVGKKKDKKEKRCKSTC